jgi:hypothetical protein
MKLPYLKEAGYYEMNYEDFGVFCQEQSEPEKKLMDLLPNPVTGLPAFMGLSPSKNQRRKFVQMLEREMSIDELREFPSQKKKVFAVLGVFRLLRANIHKLVEPRKKVTSQNNR